MSDLAALADQSPVTTTDAGLTFSGDGAALTRRVYVPA